MISGRRAVGDRPPEVVALTLLFCGAFAALVSAVLFPMSEQAPVGYATALLPVTALMAGGTWWAATRLPRGILLAQVVVATVLNSLIVALSATLAGVVVDAFAYAWLVVYVAAFFPSVALWFAGVSSAGYGVALLASGIDGTATVWAVVTVSILALAAAVAHVSRALGHQLQTDELTGALNRRGLQAAAESLQPRSRRRADAVSVAVLDLDGFKAVNDERGHHAGDVLLVEASDAWRGALRNADLIARTGGDEFVVLMPDTSAGDAERVLQRLRDAHPVAWSAGVADWAPDEPLDRCLQRADRRLYAAKAGRG